ncbi:MAG TPA: TetR/AcrR family transcriptional regulator [Solirubrobacterales bacterium]|nr:TetR/AcrR family transcriptional regulator [Solirubrobacterales bacterium]
MAAMVAVASHHGYGGATVSRVVEFAGVSRATFYEHFAGREECFRAAYEAKARAAREIVGAAAEAATPAERPGAVLEALVEALAADRATARFLLIEALAAPQPIRELHERLIASVDAFVAGFLDEQLPPAAIQIPSTALMAGVADVLTRRILSETAEDLGSLCSDLGRWINAYRLGDGSAPLHQGRWHDLGRFAKLVPSGEVEEPPLLPRGRSALAAEDAATARRQRILDATARLASEEGYAKLTVAAIATAARVPRAAFYSHFESKQEALMAAQTHGLQGAMAASAAEYSPTAPWPTRVWRAILAFFTYVAGVPHYARLDFVESYAAGAEAIRHRQQNQMVFALFLEDGYRQNPEAARLPRACSEAIAGAILGLMRRVVVEGKTERMLSIAPAAVYTILAPFIGPEEACVQVQAWARGAR